MPGLTLYQGMLAISQGDEALAFDEIGAALVLSIAAGVAIGLSLVVSQEFNALVQRPEQGTREAQVLVLLGAPEASKPQASVGGDELDLDLDLDLSALDGAADEVVNPATGEVIGNVPASGAADVDAAVAAASAAFPAWAALTPRERSETLHRVADIIDDMPRAE